MTSCQWSYAQEFELGWAFFLACCPNFSLGNNLILSDSITNKTQKYTVRNVFKNDNPSKRDAFFKCVYTE